MFIKIEHLYKNICLIYAHLIDYYIGLDASQKFRCAPFLLFKLLRFLAINIKVSNFGQLGHHHCLWNRRLLVICFISSFSKLNSYLEQEKTPTRKWVRKSFIKKNWIHTCSGFWSTACILVISRVWVEILWLLYSFYWVV